MISWRFRQGLFLFFLSSLCAQYIPDNIISSVVQAAQNQKNPQQDQNAESNHTSNSQSQSENGLQRFTDDLGQAAKNSPEAREFIEDMARGVPPERAAAQLTSRVGPQKAQEILNNTIQDPHLRQDLRNVVNAIAAGSNSSQAVINAGINYGINQIRRQTGNNQLLEGLIFGGRRGNPTLAFFDFSGIRVTSTGFVFNAPNGSTTINIAGMDIQSPQGMISTAHFKEPNDLGVAVASPNEVLAMAETEGIDAGATVAEYAAASHLGLPMVHIASLATSVIQRLENEAGAECINRLLQLNASNPQFTRGHAIRACIEEKNRALGAARINTAPSAQATPTPSINPDILDLVPVPGFLGLVKASASMFPGTSSQQRQDFIRSHLGTVEQLQSSVLYKVAATVNVGNQPYSLEIDPSFERSVFLSEIFASALVKLSRQSNNPLASFLNLVLAGQRTRFRLMLGDFIMIGTSESEISTVLLTPTRGPLANDARFCTRETRLINNFLINLNILYTLMQKTCEVRSDPGNLEKLRSADLNAYLQSDVQTLGIRTVLEKVSIHDFDMRGLDQAPKICYAQIENFLNRETPLSKLVDWMQLSIGQKILSEDILAQLDSTLSKVITNLTEPSQNQALVLTLSCDKINNSKNKIIDVLKSFQTQGTISVDKFNQFISQIRKNLDFTSASFEASKLRSFMSSTTKINNHELAAWESLLTMLAYQLAVFKVEGEVYDLARFTLELLEQDRAAITALKKPFGVEFDTYGALLKALANLAVIASGNPSISTGETLNRNFKHELKQRANAFIQNISTLTKLM